MIGKRVECNRKKSRTLKDITRATEELRKFFKNIGKFFAKSAKNKLINDAMKNPGRASKIGEKTGKAALSGNPKTTLPTIPDVKSFYHTGNGFLGQIV